MSESATARDEGGGADKACVNPREATLPASQTCSLCLPIISSTTVTCAAVVAPAQKRAGSCEGAF